MSGLAPNATTVRRVQRAVDQTTGLVLHPEYEYWYPEWVKIRDAIVGQKEIKRKGEEYLSRMKGMDNDDYAIYLDRALFYNMTAQTLNGMLGQVFRRAPIVRGLPRTTRTKPSPFLNAMKRFTKDGAGHEIFAKTCLSNQLAVGRFGALVDAPSISQLQPTSFVIGYVAEDILDWDVEEFQGMFVPTRVLLREFVRQDRFATLYPTPDTAKPGVGARGATLSRRQKGGGSRLPDINKSLYASSKNLTYRVVYRELTLEPHPDHPEYERVYVQKVHLDSPDRGPYSTAVPVIRGAPLTFIPFKIFGSVSNGFEIEQPPLSSIVDINLSHYRSYAELEYGRTFTALPVYYAPGGEGQGASAYHIGPNTVWEVPIGAEPGIVEYKGEGLKGLETALTSKEQQIAAIGGRLMPGMSRSISESNNQTTLREANEQSLLLNVIQNCELGFADLIRWWLLFRDVKLSETDDLRYEINTDFMSAPIGARELRAMQLMNEDGIIGDDVYYEFLRKAEYIPSSMTFQEYQESKKNKNNFINNPDALARMEGFADRKQQIDYQMQQLELELRHMEMDHDERRLQIEEEKMAIAAAVESTSVAATRKLGDPEGAPASAAETAQVDVQHASVDVQAEAIKSQERAAKANAAATQVAAKAKPVTKPPAKPGPTK